MPERDARFRTYLKAFFSDMLTGMSGPLSVPFAGLALWVSSRGQKVLWGCLAVVCAVFASYRVWRKERIDSNAGLEALRAAKDADIAELKAEKDAQIANQERLVAELSRRPYPEQLRRTASQVLHHQMTLEGRNALRHLMTHEPIEVGRPFIPEIPQERLNAQLAIAMQGGLVKHNEDRHGALMRTYWIISPQFRPVLEDVLYEQE